MVQEEVKIVRPEGEGLNEYECSSTSKLRDYIPGTNADIAVCNVGNIRKRLRNDYFVDFLINDFRKATKSPAAGGESPERRKERQNVPFPPFSPCSSCESLSVDKAN